MKKTPAPPQAGGDRPATDADAPRVEITTAHVEVYFEGHLVAESRRARRLLLPSRPPVYCVPPEDVRGGYLKRNRNRTQTEVLGIAEYYDLAAGAKRVENAAWSIPEPPPEYAAIRDCVAFDPRVMEACLVNDEKVRSDCHYGWITRGVDVRLRDDGDGGRR